MIMSDNTRPIPSEWAQSHRGSRIMVRQVDPSRTPPMFRESSSIAESTVTTTTATTAATTSIHLNAQGGVGKPTKKRTRASRKGPITLFNTDTANFRAMVQQYTGAPTAPMSSGSQTGAPVINFGLGGHGLGPYQGMMVPPSQNHLTLQQLHQHQQQQQQLLVLPRGGESLFSLGSNRPIGNMGISDGFLEGMPSYGQTSNDNNNELHFIREDRFRNQY